MDTSALRYPGAEVESVTSGQQIFKDGDVGQHMYIVLSGQVEIHVGGRVVETLAGGGIFGEMALIDANLRAGSAVARTASTLLKLDEKQFTLLVRESPDFALRMLRTVVNRVRQADRNARLAHQPAEQT